MKTFVIKIDDDKMPRFLDHQDEAAFVRLLSSMHQKGIKRYKMTIELDEDSISEKQSKLFKVIVSKIAEHSGQDRETVEHTLLENFGGKKSIKDFSKKEFSDFLELTSAFSIEFFGLSINLDKNGHVEIKTL